MRLVTIEAPDELLELFDKEISSFFKLIKNLEIKNENLLQTRNLLLPKLISGEIDVSNVPVPENITA